MRAIKNICNSIGLVSEWSGRIIVWLIIVLIVIINYEVVMRYIFVAPTLWSHVSSYLLGAVIATLGLAYVWHHNANVRIDVIYSRFSPKGKLIVDILFTLIFFFPLIIMLTLTFGQEVLHSYQVKEKVWMAAWHPVLWPVKAIVTIGFGLLLLQGIATFLRDVMALVKGGKEPW